MNKRKQIALNKLFNFFMLCGLFLAWVAVEMFFGKDYIWSIVAALCALLFIIIPAIFTPYCYAFDSEGVSLCYVFLPVERYLWKDIYAIEVDDISTWRSRASIFDLLYAFVFSIRGTNVGETRFYMKGNIRKTFRTKHLLEKYWDGKITGYLFEGVKEHIDKRKAEKQSYIKEHMKDEIVPMEREIRAEVREWLEPLKAQANQYDLDIKAEYFYVTEDFEELKYRPKEEYTYTLIAEIAHFGETNEDRIVVVSVDLLFVRIGKKAYLGVKNKHAKKELEDIVSEVLSEINKNGIEAYCQDV